MVASSSSSMAEEEQIAMTQLSSRDSPAVEEHEQLSSSEEENKSVFRKVIKFIVDYFNFGSFREYKSEQKPTTGVWGWVNRTFPVFYDNLIWKRPRWFSVLLPFLIVETLYLIFMVLIAENRLWFFFTHENKGTPCNNPHFTPRYEMTITMFFGSMVAGGTSEGGAAVAYPVMTLLMGVKSVIARDFSLMIQSFGMTSGATTIVYSRSKVEQHALLYSQLGGFLGVFFGLAFVAPRLSSDVSKMFFVSMWLSFAVALFFINLNHNRTTFLSIPNFKPWKAAVLALFGFIGGIFTSIAGSGIDICTFACMTLFFRVSEKVATPTSVILMALNSMSGFVIKYFFLGGIEPDAWAFLVVCMPIVCVGAPIGAFVSSFLHRQILAVFIYVLDIMQFVGAVIVIFHIEESTYQSYLGYVDEYEANGCTDPLTCTVTDPSGSRDGLIILSVVSFTIGSIMFSACNFLGLHLLKKESQDPITNHFQEVLREHLSKTSEQIKLQKLASAESGSQVALNTSAAATASELPPEVAAIQTIHDMYNDETKESGISVRVHNIITAVPLLFFIFFCIPWLLVVLWYAAGWGIYGDNCPYDTYPPFCVWSGFDACVPGYNCCPPGLACIPMQFVEYCAAGINGTELCSHLSTTINTTGVGFCDLHHM